MKENGAARLAQLKINADRPYKMLVFFMSRRIVDYLPHKPQSTKFHVTVQPLRHKGTNSNFQFSIVCDFVAELLQFHLSSA